MSDEVGIGLDIVRREPDDGATVLVLTGELDLQSAAALRTAVVDALGERPAMGTPRLVVDLSGLAYADSAGLSMLVAAHKRATSDGGSLVLRHPTPSLRRVLAVSGLDAVLRIEDVPDGGSVNGGVVARTVGRGPSMDDTTDPREDRPTTGEVPASTGGVVDLDRILGNIPVVLVFLADPEHPTGLEVLRSLGERLVDFGHDRVQVLAVSPVDQERLVGADAAAVGNARVLADPAGELAERFGGAYEPGSAVTVLVDTRGEVAERWRDQADGTLADAVLERLSGLSSV